MYDDRSDFTQSLRSSYGVVPPETVVGTADGDALRVEGASDDVSEGASDDESEGSTNDESEGASDNEHGLRVVQMMRWSSVVQTRGWQISSANTYNFRTWFQSKSLHVDFSMTHEDGSVK